MKKNLIIGAATGYKYAVMSHFFDSLKKTNFSGDVCLLVSEAIDNDTKSILLEQGINLIYIKKSALSFARNYAQSRLWKIHNLPHKLLFRLLTIGQRNLKRLSRYVKIFHLISGSRYCYYYDFIEANKDKYNLILLTDVRDVVFQADPFSGIDGREVLKFYEQDGSIESDFYTSYWIKHGFGKKAQVRLKDKMAICSGTTLGSIGLILDYLTKMIEVQAQITSGLTGLGGFDQGAHNYLIYTGSFPASEIIGNTIGEVVTLQDLSKISQNDSMELINHNSEVICVVHQFDRFPDLKFKAIIPNG